MKKRTCFLMILLCASMGFANPLIINVDGRQTTTLNGKWQYIVDPYELGYYDYRYNPDPNGWYKNDKVQNRWDRIEYSFDNSRLLHVPCDWNSQDDRLYYYEGTVWYKKDFDEHFGSVLDCYLQYATKTDAEFIRNNEVKIEYLDYDWSINKI